MNSTVCQTICSYTYSQRDNLNPVFKNSELSPLGHKFIFLKNLGYLALPFARIQHDLPWRNQMLDMSRHFSEVLKSQSAKINKQMSAYSKPVTAQKYQLPLKDRGEETLPNLCYMIFPPL